MTESIEEWAARTAPTLDSRAWLDQKELAANPNCRAYDDGRRVWGKERAAALLAYRDKVAASLVECERDVLRVVCGREPLCEDWGQSASLAANEHLIGRGLVQWRNGESVPTDFGREVARVLKGDE